MKKLLIKYEINDLCELAQKLQAKLDSLNENKGE